MKYIQVLYHLSFKDIPLWGNLPSYVLRSTIGYNLRKVSCILRNQEKCLDCMVKKNCVYSVFFETNLDKDNSVLSGRNKGAHPFVMDIISISETNLSLMITFIGFACNYIPYLNKAIEKAGDSGLGKNRAKFSITDIIVDNISFSPSIDFIENHLKEWPAASYNLSNRNIRIELLTPCRIKSNGKYQSNITSSMLLENIYKRVFVLNAIFSDYENIPNLSSLEVVMSESQLRWVDTNYYSSRQHTLMKLGGVIGKLDLNINPSYELMSYLEAMELFHVGKNISFGLGKVRIYYR